MFGRFLSSGCTLLGCWAFDLSRTAPKVEPAMNVPVTDFENPAYSTPRFPLGKEMTPYRDSADGRCAPKACLARRSGGVARRMRALSRRPSRHQPLPAPGHLSSFATSSTTRRLRQRQVSGFDFLKKATSPRRRPPVPDTGRRSSWAEGFRVPRGGR